MNTKKTKTTARSSNPKQINPMWSPRPTKAIREQRMVVSEKTLSDALSYLAETDEACAQARALYEGLDRQKHTISALQFLRVEGESATVRREIALASDEYRAHLEKIENAQLDYEHMKNKRLTAERIIEVWRSENSARTRGNL